MYKQTHMVQCVQFTRVSTHIISQVSAQSYNHVTFVGPSKYQAKNIIGYYIRLTDLLALSALRDEGCKLHVEWHSSTTIVQKAGNYMSRDVAALQLYKNSQTTHPVTQQQYNCKKAGNYMSSDTASHALHHTM